MIISSYLSIDDVAIILMCLDEVTIADVHDQQIDLRLRLAKALEKKVPDHYAALVRAGKITSWRVLKEDIDRRNERRQRQQQRQTDRIDGYDYDDLGLSPDC